MNGREPFIGYGPSLGAKIMAQAMDAEGRFFYTARSVVMDFAENQPSKNQPAILSSFPSRFFHPRQIICPAGLNASSSCPFPGN
jgi:hypothetical protein